MDGQFDSDSRKEMQATSDDVINQMNADGEDRLSEASNLSFDDSEEDAGSEEEELMELEMQHNENNLMAFPGSLEKEAPPPDKALQHSSGLASDSNNQVNGKKNMNNHVTASWTPTMSLLELAYRLKKAQLRVFGQPDENSQNHYSEQLMNGNNLYATTKERAHDDHNHFQSRTPHPVQSRKDCNSETMSRNSSFTMNMTSAIQKSGSNNALSQPAHAAGRLENRPEKANFTLSENSQSGDMSDSSYENKTSFGYRGTSGSSSMQGIDHAQNMVFKNESIGGLSQDQINQSFSASQAKSLCKIANADSLIGRRRHQCQYCEYRSDTRSHLRRHELSIHYNGGTARQWGPRAVEFTPPPKMEVAEVAQPPPPSFLMDDSFGGGSRRHCCNLCTYRTDSVSHLRRHQASVHGKEKPFQCNICLGEFSRSDKVKVHFASFHPGVPFDLKAMRKAATDQSQSSTPLKTSPTASSSSAAMRENEFNNSSNLIKDDSSRAVEQPGDEEDNAADGVEDSNIDNDLVELVNAAVAAKGEGAKPFGCLQCQYTARDVWHLRRHIADVHLKRRNHRCKVCRYATGRQDRLIVHMRSHGEMFCLYCEFSTADFDFYRAHVQSCSAASARPVSYWGDSSDSSNYISSEQQRTCRLCNVVFAQCIDLESHVYTVHIDITSAPGRLMCRWCGRVTDSATQMQEHITSHAPSSYPCSVRGCDFKAMYSRTLELHHKYYHSDAQSEGNEGPGQQSSGSSSGPAQPQNTHSSSSGSGSFPGLGLFNCPVCTDRPPFKYRRSYEKHLTQHSSNVQVCPLCVESFLSQADLQSHMLLMHGAKVV